MPGIKINPSVTESGNEIVIRTRGVKKRTSRNDSGEAKPRFAPYFFS